MMHTMPLGKNWERLVMGWMGGPLAILSSYIGDYIHSHMESIVNNHWKDSYEPTGIMECHQGFELCSGLNRPGWLFAQAPPAN